jgi:hypothetical protein
MLLLDGVHAQHQARDAVVRVGTRNALGEIHRLVDVAADHQRQEGAVAQFDVLGIALEGGAVERGGGERIAHAPGMAGGEIAARSGQPVKVARRRRLRGQRNGRAGQKDCNRAAGGPAGEARKCHGRCSIEDGPRAVRVTPPSIAPRMAFLRAPCKNGRDGACLRS